MATPVVNRLDRSVIEADQQLLQSQAAQRASIGQSQVRLSCKVAFPKSLTKEFLLVDLVNNVDQLAEAKEEVLARVVERAAASNRRRLRHAIREYGNERTRKFFERAPGANELHAT